MHGGHGGAVIDGKEDGNAIGGENGEQGARRIRDQGIDAGIAPAAGGELDAGPAGVGKGHGAA